MTSARQMVATAMIGVAVRKPSPGRNGVVIGIDGSGRVSIAISICNPGIEQGVGDVDQQIDRDIDARGQKDHRLDHRIIARQHGIDGEAADAGQVEHALGDDDAGNQKREAGADHGDDGHGGVAQRVAQQHGALADALGARGAHIILAQHVQHRGARHARDQGDIDKGQRAGRQDDALEERRRGPR